MCNSINEYKLRKWTSKRFEDGSVTFQMISPISAMLTDRYGAQMVIMLHDDTVKLIL